MSDLVMEFGKGPNPCQVPSGPKGGQFCETGGGGGAKTSITAASGYEEFTKTVSGALGSLSQKFRVAPVDIEVKSLSDSTLLTRKLLGTYGATDLNAGKIELFPTSKYAPPLSSAKLSAVAVHEYGHAVDGYLGRTSGGKFASDDPKFLVALAKDYQALTKSKLKKDYGYLGTDAKEVFAEAFSLHAHGNSFAKSAGFGENFTSDFKNAMQHVGGLF